jgi:hypothetical protein
MEANLAKDDFQHDISRPANISAAKLAAGEKHGTRLGAWAASMGRARA